MSFSHSQLEAIDFIADDYTLEIYTSGSLPSQYDRNVDQVPFSLGIPGPRFLRGRTTAYAPSLGGKTKK